MSFTFIFCYFFHALPLPPFLFTLILPLHPPFLFCSKSSSRFTLFHLFVTSPPISTESSSSSLFFLSVHFLPLFFLYDSVQLCISGLKESKFILSLMYFHPRPCFSNNLSPCRFMYAIKNEANEVYKLSENLCAPHLKGYSWSFAM
jgi:hypothetical protein